MSAPYRPSVGELEMLLSDERRHRFPILDEPWRHLEEVGYLVNSEEALHVSDVKWSSGGGHGQIARSGRTQK